MATKTSTDNPTWLMAREPVVVICGARAPVYRKAIVRNRRTGQLDEIELKPPEAEPLNRGDEGRAYPFRRGERVLSDHEAVACCPGAFVPYVPGPPD